MDYDQNRLANFLPVMTRRAVSITLICAGLALSPAVLAAAEETGRSLVVESKPISEFWLNPGFYSYHFERKKQLNDSNFGLGGEYRFSTVNALAAGVFKNSDRHSSRYVDWVWQPIAVGPVRLGAAIGVIDGYPRVNKGGWFPAVVPVASFEHKRVGANLIVIPTYKDKLYGSLSFQVKVKLF